MNNEGLASVSWQLPVSPCSALAQSRNPSNKRRIPMAYKTSTRWAALGAAILLASLSPSLLADGPEQAALKPAPVFTARQAPPTSSPAPAGSAQQQPIGSAPDKPP